MNTRQNRIELTRDEIFVRLETAIAITGELQRKISDISFKKQTEFFEAKVLELQKAAEFSDLCSVPAS